MNPVIALLALTTAFIGLLMNLTVDAALTMVPMHWRTDSVMSTPFTRCNNLEVRLSSSHFCGYAQPCSQCLRAFLVQQSTHQDENCSTLFTFHDSMWCASLHVRARRKCYEST
jgi:hypothetical protein